jgi:hypothetical protein
MDGPGTPFDRRNAAVHPPAAIDPEAPPSPEAALIIVKIPAAADL